MTWKNLSALILVSASLLGLAGCGTEDVIPGNVIADNFGVTVELSWSTGGSALVAVREADLDLKLVAGDTIFSESRFANQFEQLRILGVDANGEYVARVVLAASAKPVDFTVTVRGVSNVNANVYRVTKTFADTDPDGTEQLAVVITKTAGQFTIRSGD
ncbi:MAG: hypothetical protein MUC38_04060 [Cyclobacteriaceae bacterium]|jgi:hypothetical protein|nr:hypothetical protein [Cyclobacteriaceae bacterium]